MKNAHIIFFSGLCSLVSVILSSCAPNTHVPASFHTPAPATASVAPVAERVRANSVASGVVSDKLEHQVDGLSKTAAALQENSAKALKEADAMRKNKAATEAQLDDLYLILAQTGDKVRELSAECEEAQKTSAEQQKLRLEAEKNAFELGQAVASKELECKTLRQDFKDVSDEKEGLKKTNDDLNKKADAAEKKADAAEKKAVIYDFVKMCIIVIIVFAVIFAGFWIWNKIRPGVSLKL